MSKKLPGCGGSKFHKGKPGLAVTRSRKLGLLSHLPGSRNIHYLKVWRESHISRKYAVRNRSVIPNYSEATCGFCV